MGRYGIWTIIGILLVMWLVGWALRIVGQAIHGLAVVAVVLLAVNFISGRGRAA